MKYTTLLIALLLGTLLKGQSLSKVASSQLDFLIESYTVGLSPGLSVGVVKGGKVIYSKYAGYANLQHEVKISDKTRFNIASTAKQYTALMILDLSLKGELSLEDDIRKYITALYPNVEDEIKIRHVINHTSGIRDYVELLALQNRRWWKQVGLDNDDIIELLESQEDLGFKPGSQYSYSNSGSIVLAKIIENVTSQSFDEYSKSFFEKMNMPNTSFVERYMKPIPHRAEPYADWGRGEWWQTPTVTKTKGEGFLFTTLDDLLAYEIDVQNASIDGNELLIQSQSAIPNSEITTYGYGLFFSDRLNRKAVHHDGATYGYNSQVVRFPSERLSIVVISNNGSINSSTVADKMGTLLLPEKNVVVKYDQGLYAKRAEGKVYKTVDQYKYPNKDKIVRVEEEDGKLYWKEGRSMSLEMTSDDESIYSFVYDPTLKVRFYEDEMVEYYASGKTMVYRRTMVPDASKIDIEGLVGKYYNKELDVDMELFMQDDTLRLSIPIIKQKRSVKVLNRNRFLAGNYVVKINRDAFERVTDIRLSYDRAKNIRFKKKTNLQYQPKVDTDNGYIQVTTIGSDDNETTDILLTKNDAKGNEEWYKRLGGSSYDKASSILSTDDGFLIIGSTSSYGKGNYDMYVIKTDKLGKKLWQETYGDFGNEYGYTADIIESGYLIKGTKQECDGNSDINRKCKTNVWFVTIDKKGKMISSDILEEI